MADSSADRRFMQAALALAGRGLGNVWPNPSVGCVIVKDGIVVGRGWTQPGGRPHAETEALARAGAAARGATVYVSSRTLQPYRPDQAPAPTRWPRPAWPASWRRWSIPMSACPAAGWRACRGPASRSRAG